MPAGTRELTVEFRGRAAASVAQASEQVRRSVGTVGDASETSAKKTEGGLSKIGAGIAGFAGGVVGNAVAAGASKLKDFVGQSITAASDMQETLSKSRAIFGDQAKAMEQWAIGAPQAFGLAKSEALGYSAGLGDMARQIGFTSKESAAFGQDIVGVSADLGSFNNLETGDVLDRISAALRGEYDSLQAVIPNINAARVEQEALATSGKKSAKELTAQDKALAVQAILHKDGARAMGDFAKTSGGFANQQKILAAGFKTVQERLGTALMPILTAAMGFITGTAVPALQEFTGWFADQLAPRLAEFAGSLQGVVPVVQQFGSFLAQNVSWLLPLAGVIAAVVAAVRVWATVQAALNLVMSLNPIGLVVIAIGALVAGLIYAYQNSETFRNVVNAVFAAVRDFVVGATTTLINAVRGVTEWFVRTWQAAVELKDRLVAGFVGMNKQAVAAVSRMVRAVVGFVLGMRDNAVRGALQLRDRFIAANVALRDGAVRAATQLRDRVVGFVVGLRDRAMAAAVNLRDRFIGANQLLRDRTVSAVLGLRDRAVSAVLSLRDRAMRFAINLRDRFIAAGQLLRDRVVTAIQGLRDRTVSRVIAMRDSLTRAAGQVRDRVLSPFRVLRDKSVELFGKLKDSVGRAFSGLTDKVKGPLRTVFSWLNRNLISPLNSVTSKFGLKIGDLPKFHSGTSRVGGGNGEVPAILKADEAVLTGRAADMIGRRNIDLANAGGPGDWVRNFGEFISSPAKLVAQMAQKGVRWAIDQLLGAIPNVPSTGVPVADVIPGVLGQLKGKIQSWATGKESEQSAELGAGASGSIGKGPWVRPIAAGIGNGYLGYPGHYGVDMPAAIGTAVHSVSNGIVSKALTLSGSYGNHMAVRHADGLVTLYGHLSARLASLGQSVRSGQQIARSGNSGNSTGPHLHFETRVGGGYPGPNPRNVMRARGVTLDSGGMLQPGYTLAYNGTGAPEPVLTGSQWSDFSRAKSGPQTVIYVDGALDPDAVARQIAGLLDRAEVRRSGQRVGRPR